MHITTSLGVKIQRFTYLATEIHFSCRKFQHASLHLSKPDVKWIRVVVSQTITEQMVI